MRFRKQDRLLTEKDFSNLLGVAHRGSRSAPRILTGQGLKIFKGLDSESPRLGVAVSKKVAKQAVVRNRIRRCIRECFRKNKAAFKSDVLIKVERRPMDQSYVFFERAVIDLLGRN